MGASAADAIVRLVAQMLSTVIIARLVPAEDFGLVLLVLTAIGFVGAFIGVPFEESLTQRRRLMAGHLQTALFVSLLLTGVSILLLVVLGPALEAATNVPGLATWLLVASLFLIGQGPGAVARALSRRQSRFVDLAIAQAVSVVLASIFSVLAALAGWGVFALVLQRMLPIVLYPIFAGGLAWWRCQAVMIPPRWHAARFREMLRFSWLHLTDTGVDAATPAVLTFLVNAHFGTVRLGELNIAMRIVEPLRSAIGSIGHNLVFAMLVRLQTQPQQLVEAAGRITANIAVLAVPAFLGLAASAPILLPLLVGTGWESAIPLSRLLCVAAAVSVPFRYFFSAYSALGRPEWGLAGSTIGLLAMVAVLEISVLTGLPFATGLAVIGNEAATAVFAATLAWFLAGGITVSLSTIGRIWIAGTVMAALVSWLFPDGGPHPILWLLAAIATGCVIYFVMLVLVCRACLKQLLNIFTPEHENRQ